MGITTQFIGPVKAGEQGKITRVIRQGLHGRSELKRIGPGQGGVSTLPEFFRPFNRGESGQSPLFFPGNKATPNKAVGHVHKHQFFGGPYDFRSLGKGGEEGQGQESPIAHKELPSR
jgi:hypothetical protein